MRASTFVALATGSSLVSAALSPLHIKGSKFFDKSGNQFFIKGVAYQLLPEDPLVDTAQCTRDATLMKQLGANSIRVYHVDPAANHDGCMKAFDDNGIYLWLDLDTFNTQMEPVGTTWNQTQLDSFSRVFDAFQSYNNLAGVFVGNEVMTTGESSTAAPYVKAAARDIRAYRDKKGYRNIPVGYSAADIATLRPMLQNYLACGANTTDTIEYFALNAYEWCGNTNFDESGYGTLNGYAADYNIPIFFSETGCNTVPPRTFGDMSSILGSDMNQSWSGAIVYEWIEEANNYGIVSYGPKVALTVAPDGFPRSGTPTPIQPDFSNLQKQWKTLTPTGIKESEYTPSISAPPCPEYTASFWEVNGEIAPPSIGQKLNYADITKGSGSTTSSAAASSTVRAEATTSSSSFVKSGSGLDREVRGGAMGLGVVMAVVVVWL